MGWTALSNDLAVTGQITATDVPAIKAAGFRAIICHRPDGESLGQPTFREIADAARAAGLEIRYQPVVPGRTTEADVDTFGALLTELPSPVLAYCRTGIRSAKLWSSLTARNFSQEERFLTSNPSPPLRQKTL